MLFWPHAKGLGKVALVLLVLNEIRGLIVVAIVVKAWLERR